jgi:plastocyanin
VDTLHVGEAMRWTLEGWDYEAHGVVSVGSPSFQGVAFPYALQSSVSVTFAAPGTYHYADSFFRSRRESSWCSDDGQFQESTDREQPHP